MKQIDVSDDVASSLASAAASRGCSQDDLASMLIEEGLRREEEFELTPDQEAMLLQRVEQSKRGEVIDGDIVMARLNKALKEIASS
jgi:ribosome-binding protein aMBF1 (putative translation factor)